MKGSIKEYKMLQNSKNNNPQNVWQAKIYKNLSGYLSNVKDSDTAEDDGSDT